MDKSGVDEIIFMPRIFSLDFLLNFCVMAKVEKQTGIFTDNHTSFYKKHERVPEPKLAATDLKIGSIKMARNLQIS
ncbi:MAG: hypothetical protein KA198_04540 [Chitinophagaceae bacterium]|nr:hypothetical protein [Chitinophagaceae bacterium]